MPGQAESVAERLDALARAAEPSPLAAVSSMAAGRRNASR
jgi:hypothetical protein